MNLQNAVLVGIGLLAIGGLIFPKAQTIVDSTKVDVAAIAQAVLAEVEGRVGASSAPAAVDGCVDVGGIMTCYRGIPMKVSTTTVCSIKSPAATSTIVSASARFKVASTSATRFFIAKGAAPNATTTAFGSYTIAAGISGTFLASTTDAYAAGADPTAVISPNQFVNFQAPDIKSVGDAGTGAAASGRCNVVFEII